MIQNILFLGGGHMAASIIDGILAAGFMEPARISVLDRDRSTLAALQNQHGVCVFSTEDAPAPSWDAVILAVPPQAVRHAIEDNQKSILQDALLISICAGVSIAALHDMISETQRVIRVMPNTLGPSGHGFSALCPSETASAEDAAFAEALFASIGKVLTIPEAQFDAFTAFSCSGPAYVYAFIEALTDAGLQCGFSEESARRMVMENLRGAADMLELTGKQPAEFIAHMSTPGGVNAAAMESLTEGDFKTLIRNAVESGTNQARALLR